MPILLLSPCITVAQSERFPCTYSLLPHRQGLTFIFADKLQIDIPCLDHTAPPVMNEMKGLIVQ